MLCISTHQSSPLTFSVENLQTKESNMRTALTLVSSLSLPFLTFSSSQASRFLSPSSLCHPSLYVPYLCEDTTRGGIVLWLIQLAHQIHEVLSVSSPLTSSFGSLLPLWTQPFIASAHQTNVPTSRGDELALALLIAWSGVKDKYVPWDGAEQSAAINWDASDLTAGLDNALATKLANLPHITTSGGGKPPAKNFKSPVAPAGDENQSIANLTARLIGSVLGMDSSLACRVLSKAIPRLAHEILLPVCCSGPVSRSVTLDLLTLNSPLQKCHGSILPLQKQQSR
jgi:hypothetical protein